MLDFLTFICGNTTDLLHLIFHQDKVSVSFCFFFYFAAVHCEEWKTGYGPLFPVSHRAESERYDFQPPGASPALERCNPRGGGQRGGRAKAEKVQADGGAQRGEVLFQMRLQAHWCRHHRHLRQGCVPIHVCCGERNLLGGLHDVSWKAAGLWMAAIQDCIYKKLLEFGRLNPGARVQPEHSTESIKCCNLWICKWGNCWR